VIRISPAPLYNTHMDVLAFVRGVEAWRDLASGTPR
jgi:kynureninase